MELGNVQPFLLTHPKPGLQNGSPPSLQSETFNHLQTHHCLAQSQAFLHTLTELRQSDDTKAITQSLQDS